jgi:hypothetical protein
MEDLYSYIRPEEFHGGDYEEFRFLEYRNPVRTTQETHILSDTEFSRLMLCEF